MSLMLLFAGAAGPGGAPPTLVSISISPSPGVIYLV